MANALLHYNIKGVEVPVIFEEDKSLPTVTMKIVFMDAGSIADAKNGGISKLSFKLLNEGTKKLGTTKFATLLDEKAIKFSAYSGFETAGVEFSCLKEYLGEATKLTASLLKDPNYSEETLKKLKLVTISQLAKREDDFDYVADNALKKEIFKGTPLERDPLGTKADVEKISLEAVKEFLARNMTLKNSAVVIGGDLSEAEAENCAKQLLENINADGQGVKERFFEPKSVGKEVIVKKETQQSYIYFGSKANIKTNDKDAYKARLAGFILGSSGFGSRLMEIIRVKKRACVFSLRQIQPFKIKLLF